jgi:hypothetical protein
MRQLKDFLITTDVSALVPVDVLEASKSRTISEVVYAKHRKWFNHLK